MGIGIEFLVLVGCVFGIWMVIVSCLEQAKIADEKWDTMMQLEQWDREGDGTQIAEIGDLLYGPKVPFPEDYEGSGGAHEYTPFDRFPVEVEE